MKQKIALGGAALALASGGTIAAVTASGRNAVLSARQGDGPGRAARRPVGGDEAVSAAARYLGMSAPDLRQRLLAGEALAQVASERGRSASGLIDAIVAERRAWLAKATASGEIAPATERKLLATLRHRVTARANQRMLPGRLRVAAGYLGISRRELIEQRRAGRSLADIARSRPGKSVAGLIEAILVQRRAHLQASVAAGRLNEGMARRLLVAFERQVRAAVDHHARPRTARARRAP